MSGVKAWLGSLGGHPASLMFGWWAHNTSTGLNGDPWRPRWVAASLCSLFRRSDGLSGGLSSHSHPLQKLGYGCGDKASASDLNRKHLGTLATLFWFWCSFALLIAASHGTVSSSMNSAFCDIDHKTRSGLRLDVMISVGNASIWSRSTCIAQEGCFHSCRCCCGALSCSHEGVFTNLDAGGGRALLGILLSSKVIANCCWTWLCLQV